MKKLTDDQLVEAYLLATQLQLDKEFIILLMQEIRVRNIVINPCIINNPIVK